MSFRYFAMSDIHSFYDEMQDALSLSNFDINNPKHILIICGDVFDRGNKTLEVYNFIKGLPKERVIMVKGNHEQLYFELLEKTLPDDYDFSNGTVNTFLNIAGKPKHYLDSKEIYFEAYMKNATVSSVEISAIMKARWNEVKHAVKKSEITKWLQSNQWVDYFEIDNLIFVHSFLPLRIKQDAKLECLKYYPTHYLNNDMLELIPDWRKAAGKTEWEDARWGCPWRQFASGLFADEIAQNKVLVCGHWHTSDFHAKFDGITNQNLNIFFSPHLIALDACTAMSGFCNVLVYDSSTKLCYDKFLNILGEVN